MVVSAKSSTSPNMKLGQKSKDGAHEWDRETLCALHAQGMTDAQIADLFGCPDALVTFGRKRESFWNEPETVEAVEESAVVESKKKEKAK